MKKAFTLIELLTVIGIIAIVTAIVLSIFFIVREKQKQNTCLNNLYQLGMALSSYCSYYDGVFPPTVAGMNRYNSKIIEGKEWMVLLAPYKSGTLLYCPDSIRPGRMARFLTHDFTGYAYNSFIGFRALSEYTRPPEGGIEANSDPGVTYPSLTPLVADARAGITSMPAPDFGQRDDFIHSTWHIKIFEKEIELQPMGAYRHSGGANYLFADNHVKWLRLQEFSLLAADGKRPSFWP